ncbi:MAG: carboxypeptidase regulatory-like domain-containing protein [Pyrinomonadaceae bacterium]
MKKLVYFFVLLFVTALGLTTIQAQTTGSISGTVTDSAGAVVPGATVNVKGEAGQQFTVTTNDSGVYNIPGVAAGTPTYTVTVTAPSFKTSIIKNVKVDVATPATVNATLEAGKIEETVVITGGAEVLQTETTTVGSTIQGRQILETPISTRNALDLVTLLPGTSTSGVARTSSINGLPKSALSVQVDGVDVQDQFLKSSDGFFTFIQPKIDAIDEVTVSTSNPGSESSGDGAVGIKFQTRRGTDNYHGSAFWQHRDESLNAVNFQNNYLGLPKQNLRLNQFGGSFGGPIPFLRFGDGGGSYFDSGQGKRYFFFNYERYHLNEVSPTRTRQVLTSEAQTGLYRYGTGGASTANLFTIAGANALPNTIDPTVANTLNLIRAAAGTTGNFTPAGFGGLYYRQQYQFNNPGQQRRRFFVLRTDFNFGKDHALDAIFNAQPFRSNVDFLNSVDPTFPGLANAGTQNSDRRSLSLGFRSNLTSNLINQFRITQVAGWLKGSTRFDLVGGTEWFNQFGGNNLSLGSGLTNPTIRNAFSSRVSPVRDITDNITWVHGNHTFTFGGQLKKAETISDSVNPVAQTVTFGVATTDSAVLAAFNSTSLPGASTGEITNAQTLYAALTGRILSTANTVYLGADGRYQLNTSRHFEIEENTNGLFAQDSWRILSNLTISGGVRWQPTLGTKMNTANYAILNDFNMVYDVSGAGNIFSPGTLTGTAPTVRQNAIGEKAYPNDLNNFAPSVGVVWSPDFGSSFLGAMFGKDGTSVFRGGFSRAFIREGTLTVENSLGLNPGGSFANGRSTGLGNLTVGSLYRTPGNPNVVAPAFNSTPVYPRALTSADAAFSFSPDFHTGYVDSYSFGYQRQIGRDTVVEFRYVGNRGKELQSQYRINEINAIENGFGNEYSLAQQNLLANIAGGFGTNFRYRGAGTGTNPLPIILSYFSGNSADPNAAAAYSSANFASTTFLNLLSPAAPNVLGFASSLEGSAAFRNNAYTNGSIRNARPINFFNNCPTTIGFCYIFDNSEKSWYDSGVIEVRRRLSDGLRFQASYVYAKAFTNAYASAGDNFFGVGAGDQSNVASNSLRNRSLDKSYAQVDIRHAFKFDATWDLPFGKGRQFLSSSNAFSNAVFGGWSLLPSIRWQSGAPILMENIQIVGMTGKDLQKAVGVYYNQSIVQPNGSTLVANVTYLPANIISNTLRAFTVTGTTSNGYAAGQAPTGQFIAPAGYSNCQQRSLGTCGFRKFVLYGPDFFKMDATGIKRIALGESRNIELRVSFYDLLNRTNWRLGGWTGNVNNITAFTGTFGQMLNGWSYQDPSGSNDPGGRLMDLMLRFNF